MNAKLILLCILIVAIDVVAGILGIQAEKAQNKEKHLRLLIFECKMPSHQAYKYSLAAACLLAIAHAITNLLGGCICVSSKDGLNRSSPNKKIALAAIILSWIVAAVAFTLLMVGAMENKKSKTTCGLEHRRLMSTGGILCFVHGFLSVVYYVSATVTRRQGGHSQPV